jgi:DNA-directed RNA polymerase subunit RPC12/RpoP
VMTAQAAWRAQDKPMARTLRQIEAAKRIHDGRIRVDYVCGRCGSPSLEPSDPRDLHIEAVHCLQCGQHTSMATAKRMRHAKIKEIVERGVDL